MDKRSRLNAVRVEGELFARNEEAITVASDGCLFEIRREDVLEGDADGGGENMVSLLVRRDSKIIYHALVSPDEMNCVVTGQAMVEFVKMSDCATDCSRCTGQCECSRCNFTKNSDCSTDCSRCTGQCECSRCNLSSPEKFADCSTECSRCTGQCECSRCTENRSGVSQGQNAPVFRRRLS